MLLNHFLSTFSSAHRLPVPDVATDALERLTGYDWPGNVRELKNVAERLVITRAGKRIGKSDLAFGGGSQRAQAPVPQAAEQVGATTSVNRVGEMVERMMSAGESFWSVVYEPFMARDLTREDVRGVVRKGLEDSRGSYKVLMRSFNLEERDYKRVLNFLRKHECHVAFQPYRTGVAFNIGKPGRTSDPANVASAFA